STNAMVGQRPKKPPT
ncbi:hypothetical protein D018_4319, partial [Vibrio parahaemolyticus VP2007-007]